MNGKLDSAYSHHAACRMQQRGIAPELVELLLSIVLLITRGASWFISTAKD
ncbi:hypothetical protein OR606_06745 [Aeromonas hydrophila]|uniref:hypothetical protein n=1 Tax=Aeromonas hydrophila TaxID=644 RepID=UPI002257C9ED|nr:hypothetical protein [Aeromonas hydrophila]MCX4039898.1 hypothetical protein [Aeromonas hydrophila]